MSTSTTSFDNTPQAVDDEFLSSSTGITEDSSTFYLDVMANDLGGKSKTLYSIDDGLNSSDLLDADIVNTIESSELGAQISLTSDGKIAYTIIPGLFDYLAEGEFVTDSFSYAIQLGNGTLSWATATVQIAGQNDAPVSEDDTDFGDEDTFITGSVASNDFDIDNGAVLTYSLNAAVAGLTFNPDGSYSLDANDPAYQYLNNGDTLDIVANYTVTDEHGAFDSARLTITLTGKNDAPPNNPPVISDVGVLEPLLVFTATDSAMDTLTVTGDFASRYSSVTVNNGTPTFLGVGTQISEQFGLIQISDGLATADVVNLYMGTSAGDTFNASTATTAWAMFGFAGANTLTGGLGNDTLIGSDSSDRLFGGAGDDTLTVRSNNTSAFNSLDGGDGKDTLTVGGLFVQNNVLNGDAENDALTVLAVDAAGFNSLNGGAGNDTLKLSAFGGAYNSYNNSLDGGNGDDILTLISSSRARLNTLKGGDGNDVLTLSPSDFAFKNSLDGGAGDDNLLLSSAESSDNTLIGGDGIDVLTVSTIDAAVANLLDSGAGDDTLTITGGDIERNTLAGGDGNDILTLSAVVGFRTFNNSLDGGSGDDVLTIIGSVDAQAAQKNILFGGAGNDTLVSAEQSDQLNGGDGNDYLSGGGGNNTLMGGAGDDHFAFDLGLNTGHDVILDLTNNDYLDFTGIPDFGAAGVDLNDLEALLTAVPFTNNAAGDLTIHFSSGATLKLQGFDPLNTIHSLTDLESAMDPGHLTVSG